MAGSLRRAVRAARATRASRGLLGTVADAASVVTFLAAATALVAGGPLAQAVLALFLCVLSAVLLALLLRGEVRYGRRVRQSLAFPTFADAITTVAQAAYARSPDAFVVTLEKALASLADCYGTATGVPCRATVQELDQPGGRERTDVAVRTVARSGTRPGPLPDRTDWINDNTDFREVFRYEQDYFFCNDVKAALSLGYRNSHLTEEIIASGRFPYRATIVWPVRGRAPGSAGAWHVIGFVCVDSAHPGTFGESVDVAPGAALAHAVYSGLAVYRERDGAAPSPDDEGTTR